MRTTIDLPEPLLESAKLEAARRGVTLSAMVQDAVRSHLARRPARGSGKFELHTVRGRLLRPDLDLDRASALTAMDDEAAFGGKS
jgi:hypothetical protein